MDTLNQLRTLMTDAKMLEELNAQFAMSGKIASQVVPNDEWELLDLDKMLPYHELHADELEITADGVNGVPWELLTGSEESITLHWKALYENRAVGYLASIVANNDDLIAKCEDNLDEMSDDDTSFYNDFAARNEKARTELDTRRSESHRLAKLTNGFDI